jgi:hypothetical protein
MIKILQCYVEFRSGEIGGEPLKGQHLADFYHNASYSFHPKYQYLRQSLENSGILIPPSKRQKFRCIKIFLGDTEIHELFLKAFKEIYIPSIRGLDLEWIEVEVISPN